MNFDNGQYGIGFKDKKGNWRGKSPIEIINGIEYGFLTLAGNEEETLDAYFIDKANEKHYSLHSNLLFKANANIGTLEFPYTFTIPIEVCEEINIKVETDHFIVYPNLFDKQVTIEFFAKEAMDKSIIRVTDITGKTVYVKEISLEKGMNNLPLELSHLNFTSGVYILELKTNEKVYNQSIIKI